MKLSAGFLVLVMTIGNDPFEGDLAEQLTVGAEPRKPQGVCVRLAVNQK